MNRAYWLNTAWMWSCRRELAHFHRATESVSTAQGRVLRRILENNCQSAFGRAHGFRRIDSPDEFRRRVPLAIHDDFKAAIERIAAGAKQVLTEEPVTLLEPTSGSSSSAKLIPYTAALRAEFQRGIHAWLGDLLFSYPSVRRGRAYWSITPALGLPVVSTGGIPIGFDDDTAYLASGLERWAARQLLAVPPHLAKQGNPGNFRYQTLLHLLAAEDLVLISVWSPTFLTVLVKQLESDSVRLIEALRSENWSGSRQRGETVKQILESAESLSAKLLHLWPRLAIVSCWADAASARYAEELRELFPGVMIQPKGLLATEAIVSFPLAKREGAALALRSHFYEFIDARGELRLAHEIKRGQAYQVIVSTGGGLYRYQLGDLVEVVGYFNQCPLLRFLGRGEAGSDLVGEKLSEAQVRSAVEGSMAHQVVRARFAIVVPVQDQLPRYRLYVQLFGRVLAASERRRLRDHIETQLRQNPYYDHALRFGQLGGLQLYLLREGASPWPVYEQACLKRGQRLGNIKPVLLHNATDWPNYLDPLTETPTGE